MLSELWPLIDYQEVQHCKQTSLVNSLSEARRTLPQMWLQLTEGSAEHAKSNDDLVAIITRGQKSSIERLPHIKGRKRKRKGTPSDNSLDLDFWGAERELLDPEAKGYHWFLLQFYRKKTNEQLALRLVNSLNTQLCPQHRDLRSWWYM